MFFPQVEHNILDTTHYCTINDSVFNVGDRILVRGFVFKQPGSFRIIKDRSQSTFERISGFLKKHSNLTFELIKHSDLRGSKSFNLESTNRQAKAICEELVREYGVSAEQLIPVGAGSSLPIVPWEVIRSKSDGDEKNAWHQINNRTELLVVGFI
jgi:outer membrane protein OmpA-like peptidoglycan-associated protein